MSIIIKGMDMPQSCKECPFNVLSVNEITGEYKRMCFVKKKKIEPLQDCPLVEISTPHGRLIDGDKLKDEIADGLISYSLAPKYPTYGESTAMDYINNAPTIIEAESQ